MRTKNKLRVYARNDRPTVDAVVGDEIKLPHWIGFITITAIGEDFILGRYEGPNDPCRHGTECPYSRDLEWEMA